MERRTFLLKLGAIVAALFGPVATVSAVRGRPATPASVGGVRRRTRRRTRRRVVVGMSLASLPAGCTVVAKGGVNYHYCGGVWYQPTYQGTTVVYVVQEVDPGTEAYVEVEE